MGHPVQARGSDGSCFVPWAATVPRVPQKAGASRSAKEQLRRVRRSVPATGGTTGGDGRH